ncbi:hypothetical protein HPB52_016673 [Rhipicephalus sanguineus]|uniref:Ig-like domain-containing protein n=1 Tax=Rhipicephalus sanguineus TaxID=34632 RepID=A0A9D4Q7I7_RHISA|nr:hypothetical protein HPB52_016673 [Rhipicephalus sanguineus]
MDPNFRGPVIKQSQAPSATDAGDSDRNCGYEASDDATGLAEKERRSQSKEGGSCSIEPLDVQIWLRTREVCSGDSVTLNCSVSGFHARSVTWSKDERPIVGPSTAGSSTLAGSGSASALSRRVLMLNRYALRIQVAHSDDSGVYQCHAANEKDSAQAHAYVHVKCTPPKTTHPREESPWSELMILLAKKNDTDTVKCEVSNAYGHDELVTHISIQAYKPLSA